MELRYQILRGRELTPMEHRLERLLLDGESIQAITELLNAPVGTTRVRIKRMYAKYGITRRYELMARHIEKLEKALATGGGSS
jgi:DNA-binding NarL/FixJ family response regulator